MARPDLFTPFHGANGYLIDQFPLRRAPALHSPWESPMLGFERSAYGRISAGIAPRAGRTAS
jgi:hypothetical protein